MIKRLFIAALLSIFASTSQAQFTDGQVLTAEQLNAAFANVLALSGGTLTGPLSGTSASFTSATVGSATVSGTTTTTNLQANQGFSLGPTTASLSLGMDTSQPMTGTTSANCTSDTGIVYPCANLFYISSDNVAAASPTNAYDGWQFKHNFGGSNLTGARQTMDVIANFTAPSSSSNTNKGYVAIAGEILTNSGDGGTAPDTTHGLGSFFGMNPLVIANSGATNLFGIAGLEINVGCNSCTTAIRFGASAVQFGTSQAAVLGNDAAFHVGSIGSGTTGSWHQALNLSHVNGGTPLDSTGCVICTDANNDTIQTGIDLSHYNVTGNLLAGPNGFQITGLGGVVAPGGIGTSGGLTVSAGGASIVGGFAVAGTVSGSGLVAYMASPPAIGSGAPNTGAFTTLSASSTVSGAGFSTYLASPPAIGGTAANAGSFTTLSASSTVSGAGFSTYLASPPAIGGTTPAAVSSTVLAHSQQERDTGYSFQQPTTGQTITVSSGTETLLIAPAGTLASLTVTLPGCTSGYDGSIARLVSFQTITSLTLNASSGSVVDPATTLAIGAGHAYLCRGVATAWYPLY